MPRKRLLRVIKKTTDQKAERLRGDHSRGFWKCETGVGQQVAPVRDS